MTAFVTLLSVLRAEYTLEEQVFCNFLSVKSKIDNFMSLTGDGWMPQSGAASSHPGQCHGCHCWQVMSTLDNMAMALLIQANDDCLVGCDDGVMQVLSIYSLISGL